MQSLATRFQMVVAIGALSFSAACTSSTTPSLPKLPDTTSAPPPNGVSLKATPPSPVSPPEGTEVIGSVTMQIAPASGLVGGQSFHYEFEIASASGHVIDRPVVDGTTLVYTGVLPTSSTFVWRARAARDGQFFGPWSAARTFKTGALPGCNGGLLSDARAFFYWKMDRTPGTNANDWVSRMLAVGWPAGYAPGVRPPVGPPYYGFSQQINSGGEPRGRLFLPSNSTDELGYFSRETDFLGDGCGGVCWDWKEKSSAPPYGPQTCP